MDVIWAQVSFFPCVVFKLTIYSLSMTKHSPQLLCALHGHSTLLLFATFKSLMQINTHDIDDLLTRRASLHTINQHLADGHHILTYKALTCKYHRAS